MRQGEIFFADFPYVEHDGRHKWRPVCVVSGEAANLISQAILVAPITSSSLVLNPGLGDVLLDDWERAGLRRESVVRTSAMESLLPAALHVRRGRQPAMLAAPDLEAVREALRDVFDLR